MYKLYQIDDVNRSSKIVPMTLIATGPKGKLAPLMNNLSQGKKPHALYDVNGNLVSRSF